MILNHSGRRTKPYFIFFKPHFCLQWKFAQRQGTGNDKQKQRADLSFTSLHSSHTMGKAASNVYFILCRDLIPHARCKQMSARLRNLFKETKTKLTTTILKKEMGLKCPNKPRGVRNVHFSTLSHLGIALSPFSVARVNLRLAWEAWK